MQKIIQVKSYNSGFTFDNLLIFYNSILYLINIIIRIKDQFYFIAIK
jgi:hypothetical protein